VGTTTIGRSVRAWLYSPADMQRPSATERRGRFFVLITISLTRRDSLVRVAVHDVGETIAADSLPHIFERFYRVDPSRARGSGGAGIGLAIVKELVAAHGGIVGAESESDSVTVWFELPLQALEPDRSQPRDPVQTIRSLDAASSA
jgi:signal transduction histidine kinase